MILKMFLARNAEQTQKKVSHRYIWWYCSINTAPAVVLSTDPLRGGQKYSEDYTACDDYAASRKKAGCDYPCGERGGTFG
jgi:hypothetical protein